MTIQIINLDSLNGSTYNDSSQFNTYAFNKNYLNLAPNAFNSLFRLQTPLSNVKKIWLKSIEIPIGFNNIRANSKNNIFTVATTYDGTIYTNQYSVALPDKTYNSITTLLADINALFLATYPAVNIILTNVNGYIQVTSTSSAVFTGNIYIVPTNLSYMLGFRQAVNTYSLRNTLGAAVYQLNCDNYLNMFITNVSTSQTYNANGINCHFKVILNCVNGTMYYASENNTYTQFIEINSSLPITNLNIIFTDRWGYSLNSSGLDYSVTLAIET